MSYLVPPGLYAIGEPGPDAPVMVTANYKMSYDMLRSSFSDRSAWLMTLETHGVNVWCASGKGTFSADELVRRIAATSLAEVVGHRALLLPLLGASGVRGIEVRAQSGFTVNFSTIRAADLPAYIDNGMQATPAMRELTFTFRERLVLTPVELVMAAKGSIAVVILLIIVGGFNSGGFSVSAATAPLLPYIGAVLCGTVVTPLLLPWLPPRSFAVKGAIVGVVWAAAWRLLHLDSVWRLPELLALFLMVPAVSAFFALNFTGSTPFTSRSGVKKEMRISLPVMAAALFIGVCAWLAGRFW
jgi:acetyl-CoA decarbonylase/synthase complex subunit gamma